MAAPKSALWRQVGVLSTKNFIILLARHPVSTIYTAILLPIILTVYLGIGKNLNSPSNEFGIADPRPIRSLAEGLAASDGSRNTVVLVNSGLSGGDVDRVIEAISAQVSAAGKITTTITNPSDLGSICRSSFRATTTCYGAVVFHSSPTEGDGGLWNYTLRGDGVNNDDSDVQVYTLPLQHAVDSAIASLNSTNGSSASLKNTFIDYLAVSFILALIGVSYHLPGHVATEREKGLSQLIDSMMSTRYDWEPQVIRMLSNFYSFATIYFPGWVVASVIARSMIWRETSIGVVLVFFILGGLALTSQAILGATFFKKAQLSGVINSLVYVLLGVLAQGLPNPSTGAVAVLSLLFTPCAFVFFVRSMARFEGEGQPMNLLKTPPGSNSTLPGIAIWIFLILQFLFYTLLAAYVERQIHGVGSERRKIYKGDGVRPQEAIVIDGLTKLYRPSFLRRLFSSMSKPRAPTVAIDRLNLTTKRGQILALLGANGSGKSTTLDAIAGISRFNHGGVSIDASGGIGIAPQKNVLWDELTQLIDSIGLSTKRKSQSRHLSGGQKRKLQLGMMLTGGSAVCCVDEVSSGIDALSRRKIWDILLSERGKRTIILTTHFLDEADLLADNIAILSKGSLKAEGSSVALKNALGDGYRIHVLNAKDLRAPPEVHGATLAVSSNTIIYTAPSSSIAADVIRHLETQSISYRISSPNIEDVFLNVADEVQGEDLQPLNQGRAHGSVDSGKGLTEKSIVNGGQDSLGIQSGRQTGIFEQIPTLIRKRFTLFKTNWVPYAIVFVVPIVAAAIMQLLIADESPASCDVADFSQASAEGFDDYRKAFDRALIAAGPSSSFSSSSFGDLFGFLLPGPNSSTNTELAQSATYADLTRYMEDNRKNVTPGGFWVGSPDTPSTVAYRADNEGTGAVLAAVIMQNLLSIVKTNISIATTYTPFDSVIPSSTSSTVQLAIFFSIVCSIIPSFFGLYPNAERHSHARGLQYSSGVRSLSTWTSHLVFDFGVFFLPLLVAAIIFVVSSGIWYAPGYLFPVFLLYGITSILLSYVISVFTNSQVATFAAIMAYNSVGFAIYLIAFLYIVTFSPSTVTDRNILIGHYTISAFFPVTSVFRALLIGLNTFSLACSATGLGYPGAIKAYGGPILYLVLQAILLFGILLYHDTGNKLPAIFKRSRNSNAGVEQAHEDPEIASELLRVESTTNSDGLQVKHLTKKFGSFTAVDNVSFGVRHGEVFALLGPNGAGKSTTISLIRGDIQPSRNGGDVFVEQVSVINQRARARTNLGVCPQFDAVESMSVLEHLRHYARLRGVGDVEKQEAVVHAVGLDAHANVMAQHLSGATSVNSPRHRPHRNPPRCRCKAHHVANTKHIVPGRSILLTTHSMEEADALADRAGIIAQRMLAIGEVDQLQSRFGDSLYVHLVSRTAPYSKSEEMDRMRDWVLQQFPSAQVESQTFHGQLRFSVAASDVLQRSQLSHQSRREMQGGENGQLSAIGQLIVMLEENKDILGIEHHSVSPTTLNDVFLSIVGQHDVQEEGYGTTATSTENGKKKINWRKILLGF
ncbi:ABC transporter [Colletotrichum scovillei]|uniref:ABC transporter n=1 Tax=Colletotrichum scovillei TaxID=1209932 RepID=UPI0015C3CBBE|nr:ABC transporter [Colletotrichum scovillei]KAF4784364.1 ABC transporter [Colletotrichum scovillei]